MRYRSTRGQSSGLTFENAVLQGLAPDGGLYIPSEIPKVPFSKIAEWSNLKFTDLAYQVLRLFIDVNEIPNDDLKTIIEKSYSTFDDKDITPLNKLPNVTNDQLYVLELFHGPTFAFKDVALQFLGNLFEYFLIRKNKDKKQDEKQDGITVLGATSGDTGGAAIYGLRGKKNISVFILHPKGRVSNIQESQMTSVLDPNVFNVSVEGTFDDCQETVKALFSDAEFKNKYQLGAINSINWARILAQTVYYFYSYFTLLKKLNVAVNADTKPETLPKIQFVVPSGNFGDILAGYYAVRMGLPADRLCIATNENDILYRFMQTGSYEKKKVGPNEPEVKQTLSPAMDILISSNFERLIWYLVRGDGRVESTTATAADDEKASATIAEWMQQLKTSGGFTAPAEVLERAHTLFDSFNVTDEKTTETIGRYYHCKSSSYVLDPHTAVGVAAAEKMHAKNPVYTICLSTAHPGKFPEAVLPAINNYSGEKIASKEVVYEEIAPKALVNLLGRPKKCIDVKTDGGKKEIALKQVRLVIEETMKGF
ncbi:tryptophan synthase beta subunit-like PLP-dependent enzyme [Piromyces finnis]|uniref:threonine synthase n=1 Tax=Piromyces finnis TaxID=1754191 RepID=A0A1Y1VJN3_9FUNG|nr:tryptophan synthase beta subunit-like PLP-dependent enzyme [Piromyces finnis]|eukprot:ORX57919.1 tryptophan synthase beta subunit-like PLP-dependent enzyme [Piromyces finnis]